LIYDKCATLGEPALNLSPQSTVDAICRGRITRARVVFAPRKDNKVLLISAVIPSKGDGCFRLSTISAGS
jgi:hypothetical protein